MGSARPGSLTDTLDRVARRLADLGIPGLSELSEELTRARQHAAEIESMSRAVAAANANMAELYAELEEVKEALEERERVISEAHRTVAEMLRAIRQGLFVVDSSARIRPQYSLHLEEMLGTNGIAGRSLDELLFEPADLGVDARASANAAIELSFGSPLFLFEANTHLLPRALRWRAPGGAIRLLEVDWSGLADGHGDLDGVMVCVRDVTELRVLQQRAAQQSCRLQALGEVLRLPLGTFAEIMDELSERFARVRACLAPGGGAGGWASASNELHTIKGIARNCGLSELRDASHHAESALAGRAEVSDGLDNALATVADVLGVYREVGASLATWGASVRERGASIRDVIDQIRPGHAAAAAELQKPAPDVIVGGDAPIPPTQRRPLTAALTHALTNAVAHWVEPGSGDPLRITVDVGRDSTGETLVRVMDNGAGLDLVRLRAVLHTRGLAEEVEDRSLVDRIFDPGVSTADELNEVAGRGVGMSAARDAARTVGGDMWVELVGTRAPSGRVPMCTHIRLPA